MKRKLYVPLFFSFVSVAMTNYFLSQTTDATLLHAASILVNLIRKMLISGMAHFCSHLDFLTVSLGPQSLSEPLIPSFFSFLSLPWQKLPLFDPRHHEKLQLMRQLQSVQPTTPISPSLTDDHPLTPTYSTQNFVIACLEVLAWLPQKWFVGDRKQYFSHSLVPNGGNKVLQDERIRANAVCNLPLLLARIGYEHVTELDAKIWYDFLSFFFVSFWTILHLLIYIKAIYWQMKNPSLCWKQ